jgi:hypothetical protein
MDAQGRSWALKKIIKSIQSIKKNFQNNSGQIWPDPGQILAQTGLTGNNAFSYKNN